MISRMLFQLFRLQTVGHKWVPLILFSLLLLAMVFPEVAAAASGTSEI